MEIDFKTVKALSSPTRIKILNQVLEKERTPTALSNDIDKSKSTVSSHLEKLVDCNLVEKEAEEGRKRVVYQPTEKAETIVKEKEKKVRFSLVSSIVTGLSGLAFLGYSTFEPKTAGQRSASVMMETMDATAENTQSASAGSGEPGQVFLFLGIGFLTISISGILYGLLMRKIREE